ncbi:MAG: gamma-glutamyltransferase family protein [Acidobacteria bacterium]|nr:gamma-glutamyltransferase family protein [Acidobacteriota bacterium]
MSVLAAIGAATVVSLSAQRPAAPAPAYSPSPADRQNRVEAKNGVVTSANGLASEAGLEILRAGGNAVDAVVATAFAIGVVEPQMSGLGGSGAAVVWMKKEGTPAYLDFYAAQPADSWQGHTEPAPAPAPAQASGQARAPEQAPGQEQMGMPGRRPEPGDLRVVGIPGNVAGLLTLHEKFGKLPRERVMAPAIRLAEEGFPVGQVLAEFIGSGGDKMKPFPKARSLYFPEGKPLGPGATVRNPELAESLRRVARDGKRGFYEGPTAQELIATLNAGKHPATVADLGNFQPQWKRPLCTDYRGRAVLSAPPPENGLQVLHTLELLEPFDLKALGTPNRSAEAFDVLASALRVGQADARGNGDPNWVPVPARGISSAAFAAERRSLVGAHKATDAIEPANAVPFDQAPSPGECRLYDPYGAAPAIPGGTPAPWPTSPDVVGERLDEPGGETTHMSVVDKDGNAVALTQTNSSVWGSGGFVGGYFLNDSGFRFTDATINAPSKSRWRIRTTTIAPTIVLQGGNVQMVVGAPGGGRIPTEIVQVMVYTLDYGMDPLDAVKMPRMYASAQGVRVQLEHGFTPDLLRDIRAMGYDPVPPSPEYARLYMIVRRGDSWIGVADTRHDGQPRGY